MSSILRDANVAGLLVLRELNPFVVFCVFSGLCYLVISIVPFPRLDLLPLPALDAEKVRAWNRDIRQESALLLELATKREATGRRDRAIDAIVDVVFGEVQRYSLNRNIVA